MCFVVPTLQGSEYGTGSQSDRLFKSTWEYLHFEKIISMSIEPAE